MSKPDLVNSPEECNARVMRRMIDECVLNVNETLDALAAKLGVERSRFVRRNGRTIWIGKREIKPGWDVPYCTPGQMCHYDDARILTCGCGRFIPYEDSACSPKCLAKIAAPMDDKPPASLIAGHLRGLEQIRRGEIILEREVKDALLRRWEARLQSKFKPST